MSFIGDKTGETLIEDLPNLKIEIENDLDNRMDTDNEDASSPEKVLTESSETEEGELIDDDDKLDEKKRRNTKSDIVARLTSQIAPKGRSILKYDTKEYVNLQHESSVKNPNGAFVTGVDIFSPEEQAKLNKRAQRFGIEASEAKVLSGKLLKKLYKSMGVKQKDKNIRTEALHMRGTQQMTTQDVFSYFKDYGPASLEWITDNSCNVVWLDEVSAARALLGLSVHIAGQTTAADQPTTRRQSLSDSDVEMEMEEDTDNLSEESDAVPLADLGVELPPGRWRRGAPNPLSPLILLRFATTSDRSLPRPGYTKFGSHQFGGYVGLISESRKRRMQNTLPAPIMFDDVGDEALPKPSVEETDNANPWGMLAQTWSQFDKVRKPRPPSPVIERILPMPPRMTPPPSPPMFLSRPKLVPRTRLRRERVTERRVSDPGEESSDNEDWRMRSKMPRMRMHADDEEKKQERKMKRSHRNRSQSTSPSRRNDLRLKISTQRHSDGENVGEKEKSTEPEDEEVPDLRVAVAAERSASPEESKVGIRQALFQSGNVKSVLRGARGHSENDDDDDEGEDESDDTEKVRLSTRRHRSRSRERRKHQRKHRKETHHRSRRKDSDSDSDEKIKTVKSTIRKKSPEGRSWRKEEDRERWTPHENRERRSPRHKRRRNEEHKKYEGDKKGDSRDDRRHRDSRSGRDLRSKLVHSKHKNYDSNNEFRSKSPLQIEINNDEYYKEAQSD
uniref:Nuclear cap-binding protein subunit 3 n=1 Tax=Graphocephala atropunctata TaxID=36148 RepID=A0A1B6MDI3_9HEMI